MSQKDGRIENQEGKFLRFAAGRGEQVGAREEGVGVQDGLPEVRTESGCQCLFGKKLASLGLPDHLDYRWGWGCPGLAGSFCSELLVRGAGHKGHPRPIYRFCYILNCRGPLGKPLYPSLSVSQIEKRAL